MEEKKEQAQKPENEKPQGKRLSYDEVVRTANELYATNQKLMHRLNEMQEVLNNKQFDYMSFFVSMLFKVMDHPEHYNNDFVAWCSKHIEEALRGFDEEMNASPEEKDKEEIHEAE